MNHSQQQSVYDLFIQSLEAAVSEMKQVVAATSKRQQEEVEGGASFLKFQETQLELQQLRKAACDFEKVLLSVKAQDEAKFLNAVQGQISSEVAHGVAALLKACYEKVLRDSKRSAA
tara:strand:- start:46 stop:396 length:351 start_codon:yes stop_codon:yes gene_type:complete